MTQSQTDKIVIMTSYANGLEGLLINLLLYCKMCAQMTLYQVPQLQKLKNVIKLSYQLAQPQLIAN